MFWLRTPTASRILYHIHVVRATISVPHRVAPWLRVICDTYEKVELRLSEYKQNFYKPSLVQKQSKLTDNLNNTSRGMKYKAKREHTKKKQVFNCW